MRPLLVRLALVLFSACTNGGGGGGGDDTQSPPVDAPPTNGSVTPQTGTWRYANTTPVSSTCPGNIMQTPGSFVIDQSSTTSFHIVPGDGTAPFTCTLNGKAFDCPDRAAGEEDYRPGLDLVATFRAQAAGTFSSATRATGRQKATVTCTGSACMAIGTFPCTIEVDFEIQTP
jgi:hypothetical protein